ncbi:MAG: DUF445 family protein [Lachnospiraceae bacterium]|nr:DUF445 family protein [Lachnospiraceae bacterium]
MEILKVIVPVLVGALIGYFTNQIAIKMLFRPRREIRIGTWRVPFTPGIIPKNQSRLAGAIGNAVGGHLLNLETLRESFQKNGIREKLVEKLTESIYESKACLRDFFSSDEVHREITDKFGNVLTEAIMTKVKQVDFKPIVAGIGRETMGDLLNNKVITMLLTEERQDQIYERIAVSLRKYLDENGEDLIRKAISQNMEELEKKPFCEIVQGAASREELKKIISYVMDTITEKYGAAMIGAIDISGVVRQRVESMDVEEMENLTLSVMKNELQAVINLGALIGAVIGVINIFI